MGNIFSDFGGQTVSDPLSTIDRDRGGERGGGEGRYIKRGDTLSGEIH
jgi:hypothetical protein